MDRAAIQIYRAVLGGTGMRTEVWPAGLAPLHEVVPAIYPMRWWLALGGYWFCTRPSAKRLRALAILAERPTVVHYVEVPLATAIQVKQWLEAETAR